MEDMVVVEREVTREVIDDFICFSKRLSDVNTLVMNKEYLTGKYLSAKSKIYELWKGVQIVGRAGIVFKGAIEHGIERRSIPIAFVYDMYILPEYRAPFTNVVNLYKSILRLNADTLILHTSNKNSENIYRKLFRLPEITRLRIYCLPVFQMKLIRRLIASLKKYLISHLKKDNDNIFLDATLMRDSLLIGDIKGVEFVNENIKPLSQDLNSSYRPENEYIKVYLKKEVIQLKLKPIVISKLRILVIYKFLVSKHLGWKDSITLFLKLNEIAKINECSMTIYALNVKSDLKRQLSRLPSIGIPESMMPHPIPIYAPNIKESLIDSASKLNIGLDEMDFV